MEYSIMINNQGAQAAVNGLKAAVCHLLDISEQEYAERLYEAGVSYLGFYIPNDPAGARQLLGTRSYWAWWVMNWEARDKVFVCRDLQRLVLATRRSLYDELHNPETLASAIYPGRLVLELSYSQMIQSLFDTEMHQQ